MPRRSLFAAHRSNIGFRDLTNQTELLAFDVDLGNLLEALHTCEGFFQRHTRSHCAVMTEDDRVTPGCHLPYRGGECFCAWYKPLDRGNRAYKRSAFASDSERWRLLDNSKGGDGHRVRMNDRANARSSAVHGQMHPAFGRDRSISREPVAI